MKKVFLFTVLASIAATINAQILFVNNVQVTIQPGAFVKTMGGIKIEGTGAFAVHGELQVAGDIVNDGVNGFLPADGKVILNGAQQTLSGNNAIYFPILEISGTGKKIMQQDVFAGNTVTVADNILLLNNQPLQLNNRQLTILSSSASAIQRSGNGFVESETSAQNGYGYLQWNIKNNTGNYVFPFGKSSSNTYLPLTASLQQGGTGTNGFIRAAMYPTDATQNPNNRPFPTGVTNMNNTSGQEAASKIADRFWIVEAGNYTSKPVANLTLSYLDAEWDNSNGSTNSITEALLTPHAWNGSQWMIATGTSQANNNTLTIVNNNFSSNTWRATQGTGALPVTLLSFTAHLNNDGNADIRWSTATEINSSHFEIEKSTDAATFVYLRSVAAAGNSTTIRNYYELDDKVAAGTTFYRLKMIDMNGDFKYSGIASIKKQAGNEVQTYPNPASDNISVAWAKPVTENISCNIHDASGRIVMQWTVASGNNKTTRNISMLSPGTYSISWTEDGKRTSRLFIKN